MYLLRNMSIMVLTVPGLWRLHPRSHTQLRTTAPIDLSSFTRLAKHRHNRRQSSGDVETQLAAIHLTDPLPASPDYTTSISNRLIANNVLRSPFTHIPILRDAAPINTLLHDHLPPIRPDRFPRSRQSHRCLLRLVFPAKVQEIPRFARRRIERVGEKGAQDNSVPDRCHRYQLGLYLPLPIPPTTHLPPLHAMVPRRLLGRFVGICGSERWEGTFHVQCAVEHRQSLEGGR